MTENRYRTGQGARRGITHVYHPFNLDTGEKQNPEIVRKKLEKSYTTLETIAKKKKQKESIRETLCRLEEKLSKDVL